MPKFRTLHLSGSADFWHSGFPILVLSVFVWLSGPTWFSLFLLKFMITLFEILNVILLLWGSEYSGDLNSELVQYLNGPKEFTS